MPGRRGRRSCPRRRTPTPPSCCAPRRRGWPPTSSALHGVMHGLPLTYNKDMQEDKEPLFDAADTLALCLEAANGMLGSIAFRRERLAQAASDEFLAATDVADLLVRRGVPFRQAHGVVAGLVRTAVQRRQVPVAAERGASSPSSRRCWTASSMPCSPTAPGLSRRSLRAAPASTACASSCTGPDRCSPGLGEALFLRAAGARGRPRPGRLRGLARRYFWGDCRDRGVPRLGAGEPRVRGTHTAHSDPVRTAGPGVRVSLLRDPRVAERRL